MPDQNQWPPPPDARALLNPPSFASQGAEAGWYRHQCYYPEPPFPLSPNTALQPRDRSIEPVIAEAAGAVILRTLQFSIPAVVYAITGTAIDVNGQALPIGMPPLNTFLVQCSNTIGDQFQTEAVAASEVVGDARLPRLIGGVGWLFDRGGSLLVEITPQRDDLWISLCFWCIEVRGGQNYGIPG